MRKIAADCAKPISYSDAGLLRADMEGNAIGVEAERLGAHSTSSIAISGSQPNLRDKGHSVPFSSVRMRTRMRVPGAARATFSTSSTQSHRVQ